MALLLLAALCAFVWFAALIETQSTIRQAWDTTGLPRFEASKVTDIIDTLFVPFHWVIGGLLFWMYVNLLMYLRQFGITKDSRLD